MKIILDISPLLVESVGIRYYTINLVRNILKLNEGREVLLFPFLTEKTKKNFEGLNYKVFCHKRTISKMAIRYSIQPGRWNSYLKTIFESLGPFLDPWNISLAYTM